MNELGANDFGAGKVMVVASLCQRYAKLPFACDACISGCPTDALEPREYTLFTNDNCLKCGACLALCPMSSLGTTRQTIQEISRKLLDASLKTSDLVLSCQRTEYLAAQNSEAFELSTAADDGILYNVACLAMIPTAVWFALLNEITITPLERVGVLLPPGQCANCPVNAKANIEELIDQAISTAEVWAETNVELYGAATELPSKTDTSLLDFLRAPDKPDRREALTGVFKGLKSSWDQLAERDNRALREVQIKRQRRDAHKHTLLAKSISQRSSTRDKANPCAVVVPSRYQLIDALGRNPTHASTVILSVSGTDTKLCALCGKCVDACALHARQIVTANKSAAANQKNQVGLANGLKVVEKANGVNAATNDAASNATSQDNLTSVPSDGTTREAVVNCEELSCVGCGACVRVCPNNAANLVEITGERFLL